MINKTIAMNPGFRLGVLGIACLGVILYLAPIATCQTQESPSTKGPQPKVRNQKVRDGSATPANPTDRDRQFVVLVQGASGKEEFQQAFVAVGRRIEKICESAKVDFLWIGKPGVNAKSAASPSNVNGAPAESGKDRGRHLSTTDLEQLESCLTSTATTYNRVWIILVGHGTFDGRRAKFNLTGPDLNSKDLNLWLDSLKDSQVAIINCASASGPFINHLSAPNRIVLTATKSGYEFNYTRFGNFFAEALSDLKADIDKDRQVSLLEAFLFASRRVEEFYKSESRLATEHALLDDNGDAKGTPASFFRGVRVVKESGKGNVPDGARANQFFLVRSEFEKKLPASVRQERDRLELELEKLRVQKDDLDPEVYFQKLQAIALKLARLYESADSAAGDSTGGDSDGGDSDLLKNKADPAASK